MLKIVCFFPLFLPISLALYSQKLVLECDLHLYQQSHSHSDEEYHSLLRHRQQLQRVRFLLLCTLRLHITDNISC